MPDVYLVACRVTLQKQPIYKLTMRHAAISAIHCDPLCISDSFSERHWISAEYKSGLSGVAAAALVISMAGIQCIPLNCYSLVSICLECWCVKMKRKK